MRLSVVICTHNPRRIFLERTLAALQRQRTDKSTWELILIDNASLQPLVGQFDLSWHPRARHVREDRVGVAHARIRGMREAATDLILFVDDDNLLAEDYIERGLAIADARPDIGVWGGQLIPEFEREPEEWTRRWWRYAAISLLENDVEARHLRDYDAIPPTAGGFLRRAVWKRYLALVEEDPRHLALGGRGDILLRGEDTDIALCVFDLNLKAARFAALRLTHIMPASRLQEGALLALVKAIAFSTVILEGLRNQPLPAAATSRWSYWRQRLRAVRLPRRTRRFYLAELQGRRQGVRELARLGNAA